MKMFVISHSYIGDGQSQMLLAAATHWVKQLGWTVDAVSAPNMTAEAHQAVANSGMVEIERAHFNEKYDIALINCLRNIQFVNFIYPHVPIVLWAHEAETILKTPVPREKWEEWFSKIALVIFQTEAQARLYRKYIPESDRGKIAIVPNGIPPLPARAASNAPRDGAFRIVNLGKLTPMKGQAELIRAAVRLSQKHKLTCTLIGDLEYLAELDRKALDALDSHPQLFSLPGYLPRQKALETVAGADLFCFPSISESFGLAPLEAAMLGVPVVLADIEVYKSVGWVYGENCLTFKAGDAKKLEAVLDRLIGDAALRATIAANGKALAARYQMGPFLKNISEKLQSAV